MLKQELHITSTNCNLQIGNMTTALRNEVKVETFKRMENLALGPRSYLRGHRRRQGRQPRKLPNAAATPKSGGGGAGQWNRPDSVCLSRRHCDGAKLPWRDGRRQEMEPWYMQGRTESNGAATFTIFYLGFPILALNTKSTVLQCSSSRSQRSKINEKRFY